MKNKDNVDLICDIAELAGLFERSSSLTDFLDTATSIIAWHMKAAVCSIYLYEEASDDLVLRATQGLNRSAVGNVRLQIGEGITGLAMKELRPICEGRGSKNSSFKYIPGILEEKYEAFLAVPILRGLARIGVLVAQDPEPNYFDENDVKALRAIAGQLATTIENANLLMSVHAALVPETPPSAPLPRFIKGVGISSGVALGKASVVGEVDLAALRAFGINPEPRTLDDFRRALQETEEQLTALQNELDEELSDVASLIFSAHLLILKDASFTGAVENKIVDGITPPEAVSQVLHEYIDIFAESNNPRLREKVLDLKDLGHRLLLNLMSHDPDQADYGHRLIVAQELLPSELLKLAAQRAAGLVLLHGGVTSHISILARSLNIPAVVVDVDAHLTEQIEDREILIDASQGTLYIEPDQELRRTYAPLLEPIVSRVDPGTAPAPETYSADGARVHLRANINLLSDVSRALNMQAEGVGLYRSELPFIVRDNFPSEEEQYRIYRRLVERMDGRPVTFRTLDVGGDKNLSYASTSDEANPFLGLRAIRFSLRNRHTFEQQLRAMLRAGHNADIRIMFPLISSVDDFLSAREVVQQCQANLQAEGLEHNPHPQLGLMVELPSAVELIEELCQEADFISIGTNDLVQYLLAVDRTNEKISDLYVPYHPAVLRALHKTVEAALHNGIEASICGDAASDPRMIAFLVGCGIRAFSVDAQEIPAVQAVIQGLHAEDARKQAMRTLRFSRISEIEAFWGDS